MRFLNSVVAVFIQACVEYCITPILSHVSNGAATVSEKLRHLLQNTSSFVVL